MKKLLYTLAAVSLSHLAIGQTPNKNYVKATTYQAKTQDGTTNATTGQGLADDEKIENITYFDGLGRPVQGIAKQAGGDKEDIITPVVYDELGRQTRDYLPFARGTSSLNFDTGLLPNMDGDIIAINTFYNNKYPSDFVGMPINDVNPFSEKHLEASPLNRMLEQGAPGKDWLANPLSDTDHTIKFDYQTNISNEVRLFKVSHPNNDTEQTALEYEDFYAANELYKTITKDENWQPQTNLKDHTTEEFRDKQGRVILKRTYNDGQAHDTYYVYDDYGNLTYVLSPEGSDAILDGNDNVQQPVLDRLCYQYRYDRRNRLIEKKIPGKGWEYIVYNKLDRPILTQDANLDAQNLWLFTKYDAFGRVAYTGTMGTISPRATLQASVDTLAHKNETRTTSSSTIAGTVVYYDNQAYPTMDIQELLTINYYDDYSWDTGNSFEASYDMALSGLSQTGNQIEKTSAAGWNAGFKSQATITGDGYVQWAITQTDRRAMVGLSRTDSSPDDGYNTIDHAIYTGTGTESRVFVYEEGASQSMPVTYCAVGDVFSVERSGDRILYRKNGEVFHSSGTASTGTLVGDSSFYDTGTAIEDVLIGYSVMGQAFSANVKGLATGSKVRVLGTDDWITNVSYYDDKGRLIHSFTKNPYLNTTDAVSSLLNFTGKSLKNHSTHKLGKAPLVTVDRFTYDHAGRLLRQVQSINSGAEQLIAKNNYDGLGQLVQKQVGGTLPQWSTYVNYDELYVDTTNNIITKTGGANVWTDAGVATQESIQGDGYLGFKVTQVWNSFMAGLSYTDANVNYTSINYAIYIYAGDRVFVYENGVNKGEKTDHVPGDVFSVERRGTGIHYLKNGEAFYASQVPTTTASMVGDVSILHVDTVIKDLVLVNLENTLQDVDYTYNIRGWLKGINDPNSLGSDLFGFQIGYNDPTVQGATPLFNGNISETLWKTGNVDNGLKSYRYTYDALNRITTGIDNTIDQRYSLGSTTDPVGYDKNGNIMDLYRKGHTNGAATTFGAMDNLAYVYDGNQLKKVTDSSNNIYGFMDGADIVTEYVYDANGNMVEDYNKGIERIQYNHLNLPVEVTITDRGTIAYVYDATGVKLSKKVVSFVTAPMTTLYVGNFVYEFAGNNAPQLKFFNHPEGYVDVVTIKTDSGPPFYLPLISYEYDHVYQYRDHLGNIRLSYKDISTTSTPVLEILEENNYYPFGLEHKGYNNVIVGTENNYHTYLGQEFQKELGLNWHSYKWRNADPALGRFFGIDPIAEDYYYQTTYQFASNNPVWKVELEGLEGVTINDGTDLQDNTTFLQGWNKTVGQFNRNFNDGMHNLVTDPFSTIGSFINNTTLGVAQLAHDAVPGLSNVTGIENKTGNAMISAGETIANIPNMSNAELGSLTAGTTIFAAEVIATKKLDVNDLKFQVGEYNDLRNAAKGTGLDAHHVGQQAAMKKMIDGYDPKTAPAILVPRAGHTKNLPGKGIVNRSTRNINSPRQVIARDALELRRVYQVPNKQIQSLIQMNKDKYPDAFKKQ